MRVVTITVDGEPRRVPAGMSVAAALAAAGHVAVRRSVRREEPRGIFCGMGICFECLATIDGEPHVRTCLVEARDGMAVDTALR